jgi:hypothetical protein
MNLTNTVNVLEIYKVEYFSIIIIGKYSTFIYPVSTVFIYVD